jgi:hypothetical protein
MAQNHPPLAGAASSLDGSEDARSATIFLSAIPRYLSGVSRMRWNTKWKSRLA